MLRSIPQISPIRSPWRCNAARAAALALFAAGLAAPAFAACGGMPVTVYRIAQSYSCYNSCAISAGGRILKTLRFEGDTIALTAGQNQCYAACTATPGCTSVQFSDWYEWPKGPSGPPGRHYMTCTLFSGTSAETTVYHMPRGPGSEGADTWVCHALPANFRAPDVPIGRDDFRQDQYRPGPGSPGPPRGPNKP